MKTRNTITTFSVDCEKLWVQRHQKPLKRFSADASV